MDEPVNEGVIHSPSRPAGPSGNDPAAGLNAWVRRGLRTGLAPLLLLVFPAFAAGPCPAASGAPYTRRLFDGMAQIDGGMAATVVARMDEAGVERMALFARVRKRDGEPDVLELKKRYPQRFVVGTPKRFDQRGDLGSDYVTRTLAGLREGPYTFVGEILFVHGDKIHGEQTATGERYVSAAGKEVDRLMSALVASRTPVLTHWEVYDWDRDWPLFDRLYAKFPTLPFVWPHAGFGSALQARTVLAGHPNVRITLSKLEQPQVSLSDEEKASQLGGAIVDDCGTLLPEWRALLEAYPDRFLFATDAHKAARWEKYADVVKRWRLILGQLPIGLAERIAWRNAEALYGKPR